MKFKRLFFELFFLDFQFNSSTQNFFNSKSIVEIFSTNGGQSHLKLQASIQKKIVTLKANISQSIGSNFMKFLPHYLRQVNNKILRLYFFVFLDERNRNDNFDCFMAEKWPLFFRG